MSDTTEIQRSSVSFSQSSDGCRCDEQYEPEDDAQEKKRNLTMKYGQKQRQMVQKRLKVEDWLDSELKRLYDIQSPNETYPCDPDLDDLIEIKSERGRRESIMELVKDCKQAEQVIQTFVAELIEKMAALS